MDLSTSIQTSKSDTWQQFMRTNHQLKFFRLQWVDYSGVLRTRIVTRPVFDLIASGTEQYSLAQNCMVIPISTAPACFPDGIEDWKLRPDLQSMMVCGFSSTHASVMCKVAHNGLSSPLARCPRELLQHTVYALQLEHEAKLMIGFEIEFVLLDESYGLARTMDRTVGFSMMAGIRTKNLDILEEVIFALNQSGIEVYHFHTEVADQFEIALSPLPPTQAIDAVIMAQETIRTVSLKHGLRASTAPKPVLHGPVNGLHAHLSLHPPRHADSFLAGILENLPSLCAFGLANYDSYCRVAGDCAGEWVGWGTGNKDLPIRQVKPGHWELRFLDATANIYLFVATVVLAGMAGMKQDRELTIRDCDVVPSSFPTAEAARPHLNSYGITQQMPKTLNVALEFTKANKDLYDGVGIELLTQYVKVKEKEVEHFGKMADEERRQKLIAYF